MIPLRDENPASRAPVITRALIVINVVFFLYELLIGAVPFDAATLRNAGLAEMLRIIREDEAPSLAR